MSNNRRKVVIKAKKAATPRTAAPRTVKAKTTATYALKLALKSLKLLKSLNA